MTTAGVMKALSTLASVSDPARRPSLTDSTDRLPTIKAVTGGRKRAVVDSAVVNTAPAIADEVAAAAAEVSTTVSEAAAASEPVASLPATLSVAPAAAAQPAPASPLTKPSEVTTIVATLASTLGTAALEPDPQAPAPPSPALWALLAWTRRQIGETSKTLFDPAPPAAIQTTGAQPFALPDITDPGSALTTVSGIVAHALSIYDFNDPRGVTAFVLDYSWGLTGTALGAALQIVNTFFVPNSDYDAALSEQLGFFVYNGGIIFFPGFITTLGNVTTNAGGHVGVVEDHEAVHVFQSRVFGPLFQASYVAWLAGGAVVGTAVWLTDTNEDWWSLVETAAYYDNPWEVWAYTAQGNWPPSGANPKLLWQLP
jgi:hypothetical protein